MSVLVETYQPFNNFEIGKLPHVELNLGVPLFDGIMTIGMLGEKLESTRLLVVKEPSDIIMIQREDGAPIDVDIHSAPIATAANPKPAKIREKVFGNPIDNLRIEPYDDPDFRCVASAAGMQVTDVRLLRRFVGTVGHFGLKKLGFLPY